HMHFPRQSATRCPARFFTARRQSVSCAVPSRRGQGVFMQSPYLPDQRTGGWKRSRVIYAAMVLTLLPATAYAAERRVFAVEEATIADVHRAILARQLTATQLVNAYLKRIEMYNGTCVRGAVDAATGLQLGDIEPIEHAGKLSAIIT